MALTFTLQLSATAFRQGLAGATAAVRGFAKTSGGILGGTAAAARGLVGAMHQVNGAFELMQRMSAPVQSLTRQIWGAVEAAGDMEQASVGFRVLIGDVDKANKHLAELRKQAAATPLEFPDLAEADRLLIAFGFSADESIQKLMQLGDIASGVQTPLKDLADIFGKARVSGVLFTEDINQLTGRGIPVIKQFAEILGVGEGAIRKLAEQGKLTFPLLEEAIRRLTTDGGLFTGMMEQQSRTFKGLMSTLADGWRDVKIEFGTPLLESLKPVLDGAIAQLVQLKTRAQEIGSAIGGWVTYIQGAFKAGGGWDALLDDLKLFFFKASNALIVGLLQVTDIMANKLKEAGMRLEARIARFLSKDGEEYAQKIERQIENGAATSIAPGAGEGWKGNAGPFKGQIQDLEIARNLHAMASERALQKEQADKAAAAMDEFHKAAATWGQITPASANGKDLQEAIDKAAGGDTGGWATKGDGGPLGRFLTSAGNAIVDLVEKTKIAEGFGEAKTAAGSLGREMRETAQAVRRGRKDADTEADGSGRGTIHRLTAAESLAARFNRLSKRDRERYGSFQNFVRERGKLDVSTMTPAQRAELRGIGAQQGSPEKSGIEHLRSIDEKLNALTKIGVL